LVLPGGRPVGLFGFVGGVGDQVLLGAVEPREVGEQGLVGGVGVEPVRRAGGGAVAGTGPAGVVAVGLGAAVGGGADEALPQWGQRMRPIR
jgi:hypothetical protein